MWTKTLPLDAVRCNFATERISPQVLRDTGGQAKELSKGRSVIRIGRNDALRIGKLWSGVWFRIHHVSRWTETGNKTDTEYRIVMQYSLKMINCTGPNSPHLYLAQTVPGSYCFYSALLII